jgi:ABC-type transport system substrate-binding protein
MWIKRTLVIFPCILLFLMAQSVFWVPSAESAAKNESRADRLIFYQGASPEDMNPWISTKTSDSDISTYLGDSLIRYNQYYDLEPRLAEEVCVNHEVQLPLPPGLTADNAEAAIKRLFGAKVASISRDDPKVQRFDVVSGTAVAADAKAANGQKLADLAPPVTLTVLLKATPVRGKIVSAVEPAFSLLLAIHLGLAPAAEKGKFDDRNGDNILYKDYTAAGLFSPVAPATREDIREEAAAKIIKDTAYNALMHKTVLDFKMKQGVYWTDGPFFTPVTQVWRASVGGTPCGWVDAETREKALAKLGERKMFRDRREKLDVALYDKSFGDTEKGPWWGRGPECTARDFKLTLDLLRDDDFGSPRQSSYLSIESVDVSEKDPYFISIRYNELYSPALSDLTGAALPYHVWNDEAWREEAERLGRDADSLGTPQEIYNVKRAHPARERDYKLKPQSMGGFVLEPLNGNAVPLWKNAEKVRLRRNEFYWDRKPEYTFIDYYLFDPALGAETSETVFNSGGVDIYGAKPFQVQRYEQMRDKYYIIKRQPLQYEYLGFNCSRPQLKDKLVRMALSMAINVEDILKYVVYDQGTRISGPAYPVLQWYNPDYRIKHKWRTGPKKDQEENLQYLPFNIEEAKALLAEAGYKDVNGKLVKDGEQLKLNFVSTAGVGTRKDTAILARDQWTKLGVDVDFKEYEWTVYISQYVKQMNFDVCVLGWNGGLDFDFRQLWHSKFRPPNGLNFVGYSSEKADKLMERIITVYDADEQVRMAREIFDTIAGDFPYVFLYSPLATTVFDRRIIWRKEVGKKPDGTPIYENRPVNHESILNARAGFRYWEGEFLRLDEIPTFNEQDYRR